MAFEETERALARQIDESFAALDAWLDHPIARDRMAADPPGWSADRVLDHVALTNRFLLLTLTKWVAIAERRAARGGLTSLSGPAESDLGRLAVIGKRGSFPWPHPGHMEPAERPDLGQVRLTLDRQRDECRRLLDRMHGGVGALATVRMTVAGLGRIDLYQWLGFLLHHVQRHVQQLASIAAGPAA